MTCPRVLLYCSVEEGSSRILLYTVVEEDASRILPSRVEGRVGCGQSLTLASSSTL